MCSHPDKKDDTGTWYWVPGGKKGAVVGDDVEEGPAVWFIINVYHGFIKI